MACYRAAIGGVARSGGNRNWGKLDWIVEEKDRCWFVSCLFWMSHRAEWKGEHRFWRSSRCFIIPFRYAERICFSQYFRKQVFCSRELAVQRREKKRDFGWLVKNPFLLRGFINILITVLDLVVFETVEYFRKMYIFFLKIATQSPSTKVTVVTETKGASSCAAAGKK